MRLDNRNSTILLLGLIVCIMLYYKSMLADDIRERKDASQPITASEIRLTDKNGKEYCYIGMFEDSPTIRLGYPDGKYLLESQVGADNVQLKLLTRETSPAHGIILTSSTSNLDVVTVGGKDNAIELKVAPKASIKIRDKDVNTTLRITDKSISLP